MTRYVKTAIAILLALVMILSFLFHEFIWELLLLGLAFAKNSFLKFMVICKKFFFKNGVVSLSTVAWKHVLMTSAAALGKRAIINNINAFFFKHITQPLIKPISRYIKIRWRLFKTYNIWKKIYTIIFSTIPATIMLWIIGVIDIIMMFLHSFSLAKFLTLILKIITITLLFFQNIWRIWIQPYLDYILITILLGFIERIPFVGRQLRKLRVTLRWYWRKLRHKREHIIRHHVDANVNRVGERIHQHVNKKKEIMAAQMKANDDKADPGQDDPGK